MIFILTSLAVIFLLGILLGSIFTKLHLPGLLGMLLAGIILGPYSLNWIDSSILSISPVLRQIALVIILTRAGLALDINDLKKVGRPAILFCFLPACFEIAGMILLAPKILGITLLEAAIMGSVVAAVSPAVIVPRMLRLMEEGYGTAKSIPQLIMAGASVDDVFVIVLFSSFTSLAAGGEISLIRFSAIPISIVLGIAIGLLSGFLLSLLFRKTNIIGSVKTIILLSTAFLLLTLEKISADLVPFSALLAIMAVGVAILKFSPNLATKLSSSFSKLWVAAEILLFVLVGATLDIGYALSAGSKVVLLLFTVLILRVLGVLICLVGTKLNRKERLFCMIAYAPKATVQAAIGGIPLAMGLPCGEIVLTVAVLSILITAPLGALGVDSSYKKLLTKTDESENSKSL